MTRVPVTITSFANGDVLIEATYGDLTTKCVDRWKRGPFWAEFEHRSTVSTDGTRSSFDALAIHRPGTIASIQTREVHSR